MRSLRPLRSRRLKEWWVDAKARVVVVAEAVAAAAAPSLALLRVPLLAMWV